MATYKVRCAGKGMAKGLLKSVITSAILCGPFLYRLFCDDENTSFLSNHTTEIGASQQMPRIICCKVLVHFLLTQAYRVAEIPKKESHILLLMLKTDWTEQ